MTSPKAILSRKQCVATTFSLGGSIGKGSPRQFTRHLGEPRLARTTIRSMNTDLHDLEQMPTIVVVVDDPVARYG